MTGPTTRNARAELDSARSAVARLDATRGAEDLAADLIDVWTAMEAALRTLVGSTVLSGQPLIREARQRQLIDFDQANSLAEFQAVRDRVHDTSYRPTEADVNAARAAFLKLDTALMSDARVGTPPPRSSASQGEVKSIPVAMDAGPVAVVSPPRRFPIWMLATFGVVVIAALVGGYFMFSGGSSSSSSLEQGITAYTSGQREAAVSAFSRAVREDKTAAMPHVYLARMAREVGNFTLASQELQLALEAEPTNAAALREMGANLLSQGNYELARKFYIRAVEADPADKMAQGYLGCTLMRLNRVSEATTFLNRAGPGAWSNCTPATTQNQAGQVVTPGVIPR